MEEKRDLDLDMVVGPREAGLNISETAGEIFTHNSLESSNRNVWKRKSTELAAVSKVETSGWWERSQENSHTGLSRQEGYCNSNNFYLQTWWAEKQVRKHNTSDVEVDELHQLKTTSGFHFCQEQDPEATVCTDRNPIILTIHLCRFEDHSALDGGLDGMSVIRQILTLAPRLLADKG